MQEIGEKLSMHWLLQIEFYHGKRCISITLNRQIPSGCSQQQLFFVRWPHSQYLQLAMEEDDIKKTALTAGSSGLYESTHLPFGQSNAGSSFCHLMGQCLEDQQFITLLFYLDDICIFISSIDVMLHHIDLEFSRLKGVSHQN